MKDERIEIGGYFGLDSFPGKGYYENLLPFNSARNALLFLVKARSIDKLFIPYYLCDSVSDILVRNGVEIQYYPINNVFLPKLDTEFNAGEYLLVVNYFGQLTDEKVLALRRKYENIILDNVQAFFQEPIPGIDTIYSCRKYFGVPDGAYLATDLTLGNDLAVDVSKDRMGHILGRFECNAADYYDQFKANDTSFRSEPIKRMSLLTENLLNAIDYKLIMRIRNENYSFLEGKLSKKNRLNLHTPVGPFAFPFFLEDGLKIRNILAKRGIYIPTLWPNVLNNVRDSMEYCYAANILPLPCDQRYGLEDMGYICANLEEFL